ncbi:cell envelope protein SmpA [Brevundimonas sp. LM2]|uniref:outer membrane protein assembly factor BamE n=1 Tax=Brevundimonas sp. LM2 TaxID=1938605 RepID=UPI000983AB53|nr:outer membrane protein assembly factor BamE [Brevundimonas sp. LM2]AQR62006.1 cell envelope protein SmpA [Brevundimonas sp. LM2]
MHKIVARLAVLTALAALAAACAPTVGVHGFQVVDVKPADMKVGEDTKETVVAQLGSPSAVSTFEDNIWYYVSQTTQRYTYNLPQVSQRSITAITFNEADSKVAEVRNLGLEDGQQIAMESRETPTRGRQLTVLEQLLGNVGRGQLPRTDEDVPGQRRPD